MKINPSSRHKKTRLELLEEFEAAPLTTLFAQETLCAIFACSPGKAERDRWAGEGVPFLKIGHTVRYRKNDILTYLRKHELHHSTVEIDSMGGCHGA